MNVAPCARCGFGVYPAEKINCIDQTWHKACFHCEICKMILTVNNFVSFQKKPYCQAHNPRMNKFTSVYETPVNIHVKKQSEAISEVTIIIVSDMKSKEQEGHSQLESLINQKNYEEEKTWYSDISSEITQTENTVIGVKYTEEYEGRKGKGSFPAMITPGYQIAKRANELASHIKYQRQYHTEMKGRASHVGETDGMCEKQSQLVQDYPEDDEEYRGKGSFPAMITPAYLNAKKANDIISDIKYKKDLSKMKGAAHYHSLATEDNLTLKQAQNVNKLVSEVEYKKDLEHSKGRSINYCETPQFRNVNKISQYTSDLKYKEKYKNQMKGHYEGVGIDRRTLHAMKARNLASNISYKSDYLHDNVDVNYYYPATLTPSYETTKKLVPLKDVNYRQNVDKMKFSSVTNTPEIVRAKANAQQFSKLNYRSDYEKNKTHYTLPQDVPELVKAKSNAELYSENKYKESYTKTKGHGFELSLDSLSILAAKTSGDIASDKAQALASDLDYRKKLHESPIVPEDMKVQWAKKAGLQSEVRPYTSLCRMMWMKGVGWMTEGSLNVEQAKKAGELVSERKYRQKVDSLGFTSVADSPQIKHAKKSQDLRSDLIYKSGVEDFLHHYTISKDEPVFQQARNNAANLSERLYRRNWNKHKEKGFELRLDTLSILTAKAKRDLASDIKYKESYEKTKGKLIGAQGAAGDSQMAHSLQMTKLQSNLDYKREFEDSKTKYHTSIDMMDMAHATMAQSLATDRGYRTFLHHYSTLPTDMKLQWARRAYNLQSDNQYKSDLRWMRGVGWITSGSLDVIQAKKASELISEKTYRQSPSALKFTSVEDTPEMIQAKISYNQAVDRKYKELGENIKHHYTSTAELPELVQAKLNAMNISETRYKESWSRMRDGGYKLKLDAIPFQAAKASTEVTSDLRYKEEFEKMKGKMIGQRRVKDDINMAHSIHAASLQSDVQYRRGFEKSKTCFKLPLDMVNLVHAKNAQSLVSEQDYRHTLHHYTSLTDDITIRSAMRAYELQSEKLYRSDLNFMKGVGCITPGALEIEEKKKASQLISESKYRQQPHAFKHTTVADSLDILHATFSNKITNERMYKAAAGETLHHYTAILELPEHVRAKLNAANLSDIKYRESWLNMRAQGHTLTIEAIPFQSAMSSGNIASDYKYKHNYVASKGKLIGSRSILDDPKMLHCLHMAKLQSEQLYRKDSQDLRSRYHLPMDMVNLVQAKRAQALASDQDYRMRLHKYTTEPEDMKLQWAKWAHTLQSESRYKSDLRLTRGIGWEMMGSPHIQTVRKAGDLISQSKYRQNPGSFAFTSVVDSPDLLHAKNSYLQCSDRVYKSGDSESQHRYTLPPDHPDFIRARVNASQISDLCLHTLQEVYKTLWEQSRAAGYDRDLMRFLSKPLSVQGIAIQVQEAFVRDKGQRIGFRSVSDDPTSQHVMKISKLQSPSFIQAKKSQSQSDINYRQHLHRTR
ncbi:hypothetical protein GDO86_020135 [Hymenochirus boettgeri]|uniref:LIM zinc-binding domain-containing protein n=1 Tax=Hymenochirus boettgeri TaxID=247094 RepID=A0A8T2IHQ2_9PIPI|nr:hypothetical protein GDO86_020135 [Hymenochirus boettgeri]